MLSLTWDESYCLYCGTRHTAFNVGRVMQSLIWDKGTNHSVFNVRQVTLSLMWDKTYCL